jgi:hypothetical protein
MYIGGTFNNNVSDLIFPHFFHSVPASPREKWSFEVRYYYQL